MTKIYTKLLMIFLFSAAFSYYSVAQVTITEWTFDNETLLPESGTGIAENVGGTSTAYASGNPGRAWNTTDYPAQSVGSGTAGVQFSVSTAGYSDINLSWDHRFSGTAANRIRLQYTINGEDWINFEASETNAENTRGGNNVGFDNGRYIADTNNTWFDRSADLSSIDEIENNPLFAVRFVTEFADGSSYVGVTSGYGTGGTVRFDNVLFTGGTGTSPLITADPGNLSGFTYLIGEGPSASQNITFSGINLTPDAGDITITAPASYEISLDGANYSNSLTISYSGGEFTDESISVRMIAGLEAGVYNEMLNVNGGGAGELNIQLSGTVASGMEPTLTDVILPMYIQGYVGDTLRVPLAWYATIANLTPNATYRYYNRVVLSSEGETSTGAGNIILVNTSTKTFTRITSPNLGVDGSYGEFVTNDEGNYSGWFMTEPTGNATRFIPGNHLFMRIVLNDGNNGTQPDTYLTTEDSTKVLTFGTSLSDTTGTAFVVMSPFAPKDFVFVYDNVEGTGRPIYGTQIESTGIDFAATNSYAEFYLENVAGQDHLFGGIVPNDLPNGIRRFEVRSITDGSIVDASYISENGNWGEMGGNTVNPTGGIESPLSFQLVLGISELTKATGHAYTYGNVLYLEFNKSTSAILEVIDLQGRVVATRQMDGMKESFILSNPEGIYLLKATTPEGVFTKKFYLK